MKKKPLFLSSSLLITSLAPFSIFLTTSCSQQEEKNDENNKDNSLIIDDENDKTIDLEKPNQKPVLQPENNPTTKPEFEINDNLSREIKWVQGYRKNESFFLMKDEKIKFNIGEKIIDNDKYEITFVGTNDNQSHFSLLDKKINKYYVATYKTSYEYLFNNFTYIKIKNFISNDLINSYEKEMIIIHEVNDKDFFVPIDPSDGSLKINQNDNIQHVNRWYQTSYSSANNSFNISIYHEKIREMLFGNFEQNFDNCFINDIEATDLYVLPRPIVIDDPVNTFEFNIEDIKNDSTDEYIVLSNDEKNKIDIDFPKRNEGTYKNWGGWVGDRYVEGMILEDHFGDGISTRIPSMINYNNFFENKSIIERINSSNRAAVKSYVEEIQNKGKKIAINYKRKYVNKDVLISLSTKSKIHISSSSGMFWGDGTDVALHKIIGIQRMKVKFTEYKKF